MTYQQILSEVKENVRENLKYLEYSKKIDVEGFANLNMIFKGNSGKGKTKNFYFFYK